MPLQQINPSPPIQEQEVATPVSFWKRNFEKKCGYAFSATYFLFIVAVIAAGYLSGQDRLVGPNYFNYENLVVYTAPEIAYLPWVFYDGIDVRSIGIGILVLAFFFFSRYLIGYAWGKIFTLLRNRYLQVLYVVGTIVALFIYGNFVIFNVASIEQVSQYAVTIADCAKFKDSASGYLTICVLRVAEKNNNPDLCFELEKMGWNRSVDDCLAGYAVAKNDPSISQTVDWKIYTNNQYGFEVKLDPSWQMVYLKNGTSASRPDMADFISVKGDGECQCSISIGETSSKNRQARWDETIVSRKSMEIAGLTAEDVVSVIEDTKFRTITAFRPKDSNSYYKFVFSTYRDSSEVFSTAKFDLMLPTFKFTN